jgi:hypothetical protein
MELAVLESDLTLSKVLNEGTLLRDLEKKTDKKNMIKLLTSLLIRQSGFFNLKQNLSPEQCAFIASDLLEVFNYETLEDVVIMLKLARQGKLGITYARLDHETIFSKWVPSYLDLKSQEREKQYLQDKNRISDGPVSEEGMKKLDELIKKLDKRKEVQNPRTTPIKSQKEYLEEISKFVSELSDDELLKQKDKAFSFKAYEEMKIYESEIKRRKYPRKITK